MLSYIFSNIYIENIKFGIVNLDDSSLSRSIVQGLENHPGLNVCYYADSVNELKDAIYSKEIVGGIVIPAHYGQDIKENETTKALIVVDNTNLMTGNNASGYARAVFGTYNAAYQFRLLEGQNMMPSEAAQTIGTFSLVERTLYDPQLSYLCYLAYIMVPLIVQTFYLNSYLLPIMMEEKEAFNGSVISRTAVLDSGKQLIPRLLTMWLIICISTLIGQLISSVLFGLPMRGNLLAYFVLMILFLLALTIMGLVLIPFLNKKNFHYYLEFFTTIYILFISTSGATWPEYLIPNGFMPVVRMLWPFAYVANPLKFLNLKGIGWPILMPYIENLTVFCLAWAVIAICLNGYLIYRRKQKSHTKYIS